MGFMWIPYEAGEPAWFLGKYVAEDLSEATCSGMTAESEARMASGEGHASQAGLFPPSLQPAEDEGADCEGMRSMIDSACGVLELLIQDSSLHKLKFGIGTFNNYIYICYPNTAFT